MPFLPRFGRHRLASALLMGVSLWGFLVPVDSAVAQQTNATWKAVPDKMMTRWGKQVTPQNVWQQYPRPQFVRENWKNLNGLWDYAVVKASQPDNGEVGQVPSPRAFGGKILVPFSIESTLSGVGRLLKPDEVLWYRRTIRHQTPDGYRTMLRFEAVDYDTEVFVNGKPAGRHVGSSDPFAFDITDHLDRVVDNEIHVRVIDKTAPSQTLGKQKLRPKGIYYTRVSGIWQTVWLEDVPVRHIASVKMKPRLGEGTLRVLPTLGGAPVDHERLQITVRDGATVVGTADASLSVRIPNAKHWTPDEPHLYEITIELLDGNGESIDRVESYAAMRDVGVERGPADHIRITLNGKVIFHYGTLDQGWWPDGLLTPPSDDAMRFDVDYLKASGFNMIRKHIKIESRRFYSYCDRVGMLVWQDMPSTGGRPFWSKLAPNPVEEEWPPEQHNQFMTELKAMVSNLRNHPSIVMWVPFNERWGQHETVRVGQTMENLDITRLVNIASGGNFFPVGDVADRHDYPEPAFPFEDQRLNDYVKVVGEFGGHGFVVKGHQWNSEMRNWGYGGLPDTQEEYKNRYRKSFSKLMDLRRRGVAAGVYTQTTDVEGEVNGLMTYDREVQKMTAQELREIHSPAQF